MSDITDLIAAYRTGKLTLDELAQRFRERSWPPRRAPARDVGELFARDNEDPEPIEDGSFDEIASAYHAGQITIDEYEVLARAASEG